MVPGRAGNRHYARTSMSDPAVCAATTMVALTPPDGLQEEAAPVTPDRRSLLASQGHESSRSATASAPRRRWDDCRCLPARHDLPLCRDRPLCLVTAYVPAGVGYEASARASLPSWAHVFDARVTSTGTTSRSCTTEAVAAPHLRPKHTAPPSPGGALSCAASWRGA